MAGVVRDYARGIEREGSKRLGRTRKRGKEWREREWVRMRDAEKEEGWCRARRESATEEPREDASVPLSTCSRACPSCAFSYSRSLSLLVSLACARGRTFRLSRRVSLFPIDCFSLCSFSSSLFLLSLFLSPSFTLLPLFWFSQSATWCSRARPKGLFFSLIRSQRILPVLVAQDQAKPITSLRVSRLELFDSSTQS